MPELSWRTPGVPPEHFRQRRGLPGGLQPALGSQPAVGRTVRAAVGHASAIRTTTSTAPTTGRRPGGRGPRPLSLSLGRASAARSAGRWSRRWCGRPRSAVPAGNLFRAAPPATPSAETRGPLRGRPLPEPDVLYLDDEIIDAEIVEAETSRPSWRSLAARPVSGAVPVRPRAARLPRLTPATARRPVAEVLVSRSTARRHRTMDFFLDDDRYARLRLIAWWDQERLRRATVLVVGAGALGNEVLKNLALVGIGHLVVVDYDRDRAVESVALGAVSAAGPRAAQGGGGRAGGPRTEPGGARVTALAENVLTGVGLGLVPRRRPGDRVPGQPRGAAVGQPGLLERSTALGRRRRSRSSTAWSRCSRRPAGPAMNAA